MNTKVPTFVLLSDYYPPFTYAPLRPGEGTDPDAGAGAVLLSIVHKYPRIFPD